jgi:hypothetical protein
MITLGWVIRWLMAYILNLSMNTAMNIAMNIAFLLVAVPQLEPRQYGPCIWQLDVFESPVSAVYGSE